MKPVDEVWWHNRIIPLIVPLLLLIVWQLSVSSGWLSTRILPAPTAVAQAGWALVSSGELLYHLGVSFQRAAIGFVIGGGIGLGLGLITGLSRWGEKLIDSSVQMVRNIPHLALIPLVILWFGIDETAKIFLVALARCSRSTSTPFTASVILMPVWWRCHAAMACQAGRCSVM